MFAVGGNWASRQYVQFYLQYEDPENPGKYVSMTCNAKYDRPKDGRNYSNQVEIRNYYGNPLTVR